MGPEPSAFLPDQRFWPEVEIIENTCTAFIKDFWDIEFKTNWIKLKKEKKGTYLEIDFRKDDVEITGNFNIGGHEFEISPEGSSLGGAQFIGGVIKGGYAGVNIGPPGKLHRPNFAMLKPAPLLERPRHRT